MTDNSYDMENMMTMTASLIKHRQYDNHYDNNHDDERQQHDNNNQYNNNDYSHNTRTTTTSHHKHHDNSHSTTELPMESSQNTRTAVTAANADMLGRIKRTHTHTHTHTHTFK